MNQSEQRWKPLDRRVVHRGRVTVSEHDVELPTGERLTFEVDESIPFAVATLVSDSEGMVHLCRQYRYAIDRWIFDLPGGAGELGEESEDAARRECREEIGLIPIDLQHLHTLYPNPGRAAWPLHLFFARATVPGEIDQSDASEQVKPVSMSIEQLDALIRAGSIVDPALLLARSFAGLKQLLPPLALLPAS